MDQKARHWVDVMVQAQNRAHKRKFLRIPQPERSEPRCEQPLNVIGCFALINAIRSLDSDERSRIETRRTTVP
jgi:hypothetical protein